MRGPVQVAPRVDADELDLPPSQLDRAAFVGKEGGGVQLLERRLLDEGVSAVAVVVVAEDGVAVRQPRDELPQALLTTRPREKVAAQADEVGLTRGGPLDRALHGTRSARRHAEV